MPRGTVASLGPTLCAIGSGHDLEGGNALHKKHRLNVTRGVSWCMGRRKASSGLSVRSAWDPQRQRLREALQIYPIGPLIGPLGSREILKEVAAIGASWDPVVAISMHNKILYCDGATDLKAKHVNCYMKRERDLGMSAGAGRSLR